jgi:hypothetical protein
VTVILNPHSGPPAPPLSGRTPAGVPDDRAGVMAPRFGDLLHDLQRHRSAPEFLDERDSPNLTERRGTSGAKVFNADGLFHGLVASDHQASENVAEPEEAPGEAGQTAQRPGVIARAAPMSPAIAQAVTEADPVPANASDYVQPDDFEDGSPLAQLAESDATRPAGSAVGSGHFATHVSAVQTAHPERPMVAMVEATPVLLNRVGTGPGNPPQVRPRLLTMPARPSLRDGATLNAQVSVQAAEHGLSVQTRLDDISRDGRLRLRDRIAAMLSRHGFIGRNITVNGQRSNGKDQ